MLRIKIVFRIGEGKRLELGNPAAHHNPLEKLYRLGGQSGKGEIGTEGRESGGAIIRLSSSSLS